MHCEAREFLWSSKGRGLEKAIEEEIDIIEKKKTWELVNRPEDKEVIGIKWIYKVKYNSDGSMQRNKHG